MDTFVLLTAQRKSILEIINNAFACPRRHGGYMHASWSAFVALCEFYALYELRELIILDVSAMPTLLFMIVMSALLLYDFYMTSLLYRRFTYFEAQSVPFQFLR